MLRSSISRVLIFVFIMGILNPLFVSAQCIDPDGDGYGTDNGTPCRTRRYKTPQNKPSLAVRNIRISEVSPSSARITATISEHASGKTEIATNPSFTGASTFHKGFFRKRIFNQVLNNLEPGTTYYFRISAWSGERNTLTDTQSFTTDSVSSSTTTSSTTSTTTTSSTTSTSTTTSVTTTSTTTTTVPDLVSGNCHEPWTVNSMNLQNRVDRLLASPYRAGFGRDTTGGTSNLKIVTNPAANGPGTYADVLSQASSGDYIIFDPANSVYLSDMNHGDVVLPGNVTIDGQLPNGSHVTLRSIHPRQNNMIRMLNGNNIVANLRLEQSNEAAAMAVSHGENYWLHCFRITGTDSTLSIGNQIRDVENSADNVTVSKYTVLDQDKGFLILSAGKSCQLPDGSFDPQAVGKDRTAQRRAHITIIDSNLGAGTRNVLNKGALVDIIGTYIHGRVENLITEFGGQTALQCSYIDSRTVIVSGIRAQGGRYTSGEHPSAPAECPKQSEIFLDNNVYRQENFPAESINPRIDDSGSHITTRNLGHMTNGIDNWQNPPSGKSLFHRPYGNLDHFCNIPEPN